MKRFVSILAAALCLLSVAALPTAAESAPLLVDDADLLSDGEEQELLATLTELSARQGCDVVIVTEPELGEFDSAEELADACYDQWGYATDGILFLRTQNDRYWAISTAGSCIPAFTDAGQEALMEQVIPYLQADDYQSAFSTFAAECDRYLTQAAIGEPFDNSNLPKTTEDRVIVVLICLGIGLALALVVTLVMRSSLKSVAPASSAAGYVREGSLNITNSREVFLYRHVSRTRRESDSNGGSSTHTSAGGVTHGGSSGRA